MPLIPNPRRPELAAEIAELSAALPALSAALGQLPAAVRPYALAAEPERQVMTRIAAAAGEYLAAPPQIEEPPVVAPPAERPPMSPNAQPTGSILES